MPPRVRFRTSGSGPAAGGRGGWVLYGAARHDSAADRAWRRSRLLLGSEPGWMWAGGSRPGPPHRDASLPLRGAEIAAASR